MSLVTPDEGQLELLNNAVIQTGFTGYTYLLDLYQNNYTPVQNSTASDFTIANFSGYSQETITRSQWTAPANVSDQATISCTLNPFTWTCGATTNTLYGYLIRSSITGKVLWAEQFGTSVVLTNGGLFLLNLNLNLYGANP